MWRIYWNVSNADLWNLRKDDTKIRNSNFSYKNISFHKKKIIKKIDFLRIFRTGDFTLKNLFNQNISVIKEQFLADDH